MRFITSLILIISIGVLSIFSFIQLNKIISVCETAKTYRIGTVDPRFGITKEELLKASEEAASNFTAFTSNGDLFGGGSNYIRFNYERYCSKIWFGRC